MVSAMMTVKYLGDNTEEQPQEQQKDSKTNRYAYK